MKNKPFVLIILDGWGYKDSEQNNAISTAKTPTWDYIWHNHPHLLLNCSGTSVGLPPHQIGNSEVGHMHIGAGRILNQPLTHINKTLTQQFLKNNITIKQLFKPHSRIHILGLFSPGGVHSHEEHIFSIIKFALKTETEIYFHAILDGRDTPPRSAKNSIEKFQKLTVNHPRIKLASICGRYYAMDRDANWERTKKAYDLLMGNPEFNYNNPIKALEQAYLRNEDDEFVRPTSCLSAPATIEDGDSILFMNFRADRARQLTKAFIQKKFLQFVRPSIPKLNNFITLSEYDQTFNLPALFPKKPVVNTLSEAISNNNQTQLHIAETEKYAHVTYFFNGGREKPFVGEDHILVPSPSVKTYDLKPEMSAVEITNQLLSKLPTYKFIVCNFANADMVGHTGNFKATQKAVETIDRCLKKIITNVQKYHGEIMITADHGNAEKMYNNKLHQPHTAHTENPVPLIYIGRDVKSKMQTGNIADIAPTILYLLGYKIPEEMTGKILFELISR